MASNLSISICGMFEKRLGVHTYSVNHAGEYGRVTLGQDMNDEVAIELETGSGREPVKLKLGDIRAKFAPQLLTPIQEPQKQQRSDGALLLRGALIGALLVIIGFALYRLI